MCVCMCVCVCVGRFKICSYNLLLNPRTSKGGRGSNGPPIGFSDLKSQAFKESK